MTSDGFGLVDLRLAVTVAEEETGLHHQTTGLALADLAEGYARADRIEEAESAYRRALSILQTQPEPPKASIAKVLSALADLFARTNRADDAEWARDRARALRA